MRSIPTVLTGSFGRFLASGGFNTLATWLLYVALLPWFQYRVSYTVAYATGIGLAYVMNRYLVFRRPGGRAGPLLVTLIYAGQYLLSLALVVVWVQWLHGPAALAPLFAVALTLPLTYLLNRRVFSGTTPDRAVTAAPQLSEVLPTSAMVKLWASRIAFAVLVGLPLLSLALNAIAWLRFGIDMPFFDDWRGYDSGEIDSLDLRYLFRPTNDTMTPIGFALDAIAQRLLDGNSVAYQLLSMLAVLGGLLLLQWKLLLLALGDRMRAAACFVFCLLMLQPGSYWGRENLAYEQALPLMFILLAVWLGVRRPVRAAWSLALVFLLGLLSGFTYISGAFGALAAGMGMVVAARLSPRRRGDAVFWSGLALGLSGLVTSAIQVIYAILPAKGGTHNANMPLGLPIEPDFWFFLLGKIGRSLLLRPERPELSLGLVLLACAMVLLVTLLAVRAGRQSAPQAEPLARITAVFAAIFAMVLVYLFIVAAGRTHFRPPEIRSGLAVFSFGFERFHFFWATLLWPWVLAAGIALYDRSGLAPRRRKTVAAAATVLLAFASLAMVGRGALDHVQSHKQEASYRAVTVACVMEQLQKGEGIRCPEFIQPDLTPAYNYARAIGASFVRNFPVLPAQTGSDSPPPWFRMSRDAEAAQWSGVTRTGPASFQSTGDAQLLIDAKYADGMRTCVMLDVTAVLRTTTAATAKLYYLPLGEHEFSELSAVAASLPARDQPSVVRFRVEHPFGFESTLRFDPVAGSQHFGLEEVEVRCRLRGHLDTLVPFYQIIDGTSPGDLRRMAPVGDFGGHFRTQDDPRILFHTRHRDNMATCRRLEVRPIYTVERKDSGQLYFRPRGEPRFSERNSLVLPIAPNAVPEPHSFVVESVTGFEDDLRFDPVMQAQDLRFIDIGVKCLQRVDLAHYRR